MSKMLICDKCKTLVNRDELYHGRCPGCDHDSLTIIADNRQLKSELSTLFLHQLRLKGIDGVSDYFTIEDVEKAFPETKKLLYRLAKEIEEATKICPECGNENTKIVGVLDEGTKILEPWLECGDCHNRELLDSDEVWHYEGEK